MTTTINRITRIPETSSSIYETHCVRDLLLGKRRCRVPPVILIPPPGWRKRFHFGPLLIKRIAVVQTTVFDDPIDRDRIADTLERIGVQYHHVCQLADLDRSKIL